MKGLVEAIREAMETPRAGGITDFGRDLELREGTKTVKVLPRYAVWAEVNGVNEVIDTGSDLKALQKKYGNLKVVQVGK